jgi:hypothetical protein
MKCPLCNQISEDFPKKLHLMEGLFDKIYLLVKEKEV